MKIVLTDRKGRNPLEAETDIDAESLYAMCRAVERKQANCYARVKYGRGYVFLSVACIDIKKTFGDFILEQYADTDPAPSGVAK